MYETQDCTKSACTSDYLGPELQYILKVKEDLSLVLIFQDAQNNVSNWLKSK